MLQTPDSPSRLDTVASRILIGTAALAPLAFWPSPYFALEAVKTIVLALGTIAAAVLYLVLALREKAVILPPKPIAWTGLLLAAATVISAVQSGHFMKSFFGQGFEIGTGSFLVLMLVAGYAAYTAAARRVDRIMVVYTAIGASFLILYLIHLLRFVLGPSFLSFGILNTLTSTFAGSWYAFGIFAGLIAILALSSVLFLPLPGRFKKLYWALAIAALLAVFIVGGREIWEGAAIVFLGLALYLWKSDRKTALIPLVICMLSFAMFWQGNAIASPAIRALDAGYSELALPLQMTLDVAAGELKAQPLFGTGPNRFIQAFLTYKPLAINASDLWGVEFNSGFGVIPTFFVTEGFVGGTIWIVFLVLFGILGARSLRRDPSVIEAEQPYARFALVSSFAGASFLWILALLYSIPHALLSYAFIMTGLWLGAAVSYERLRPLGFHPQPGSRLYRILPGLIVATLALTIVWGIVYAKDTIALVFFDQGLKELTVSGDPSTAESKFATALALHPTDIFWQGRAEAALAQARALVSAGSSNAASTTALAAQVSGLVNDALGYAQNAIKADSSNYYNYLSAARVAEAGAGLKMAQAYDTGVAAYVSAIRLNPQNPSLYVSLAHFQASNSHLDDALQTIGASLQVKNNYLDSVFLLSQVEAAKGNLPDAITSAQFAIKLNPQNPLLYFQLGLFQYTAGSYADAAATFEQAVKLQADYANAQYFLGLSYARLGRNTDAINQFQALAATNPGNQEIQAILSALRAGKSLFAGSQPALPTPPEKRQNPPLPDNLRKK